MPNRTTGARSWARGPQIIMLEAFLLAVLLPSAARAAQDYISCDVVQSVDLPGLASAIVRSEQNTKDGPPLSLDPACPAACAADGPSSENPAACGMEQGSLSVPFNTRSYLLSEYAEGSCTGSPFQHHEYSCVDYAHGASYLSGKTLEFDVDLSAVGCGCNAALYLVSMPQAENRTMCHDYCAYEPVSIPPTACRLMSPQALFPRHCLRCRP